MKTDLEDLITSCSMATMKHKQSYHYINVFKALLLSFVLTGSLLSVIVFAQKPDEESPSDGVDVGVKRYWLILNAAEGDTIPPALVETLKVLKANGKILYFSENSEIRPPIGVPMLQVETLSEAEGMLRYLPGVLDVRDTLPSLSLSANDAISVLSTGTITGQITDTATGKPISETMVSVYDAVTYNWLEYSMTDTQGYYTVTVNAPHDQVKVRLGNEASSIYQDEWYDNKASFDEAMALIIPNGGTVQNINGSLNKLGQITGVVSIEGTGTPVLFAWVQAFLVDGSIAPGSYTDSNGRYTINLPANVYKLRFSGDPFIEEWHQNKSSQLFSDPISVAPEQTVSINANVTAAGWITGMITDKDTGQPIDCGGSHCYPSVTVYDQLGNYVQSTSTSPDGSYAIGGMATSYYKIRFSALDYRLGYFDNKPTLDQATLISVTAGLTTTGVNAALFNTLVSPPVATLGVITATITKDGGQLFMPGQYGFLELFDAQSGDVKREFNFGGAYTPTAEYIFTNVPSGTYKVKFHGWGFGSQWYPHKDSWSQADTITVTAGLTTTQINADLISATGCLAGSVTASEDGSKLKDVLVEIFEDESLTNAFTDENGLFQFCKLMGNYRIKFSKNGYAPMWYNGKFWQTDADWITVSNGMTSTIAATLSEGGCVAGKVLNADGLVEPLAEIRLNNAAGDLPGWEFYGQAGDHGEYSICQLATQRYRVQCTDRKERSGSVWADVTIGQRATGINCTTGVNPIASSGGIVSPSSGVTITVGPGVFTDTVMINYTPQLIMPTGNLVNAGVFYELDAKYISNNQPAQPQPGQHYTIFVKYQEDTSANLNENNLALYYWNGSAWVREWTSRVDSETNTVVASPNHFSLWAVLGSDGQSIYLPIIFKAR